MIKRNEVRLTAKQAAAVIIKNLVEEREDIKGYFDAKKNGKSVLNDNDVKAIETQFEKYKDRIYKILRIADIKTDD